jgi:hypothetical protein
MLNYVNANTHQLKEGDTIQFYGCVFQLKNRKEWPPVDDAERWGAVITFDTDLLVYTDNCGMPHHWATKWTVQGNSLAMWALLVDPQA